MKRIYAKTIAWSLPSSRRTPSKSVFAALLITAAVSAAPRLFAAFDDFGVGARAIAIGGVGVSVGDDIYGPLRNPACAAYLKRGQLAFEYGRLHVNLADDSSVFNGFAGVAYPFIKEEIIETRKPPPSSDSISSSTQTPAAPEITATISRTLSSAVMFGYKTFNLAGVYAENTYHITYARFLARRLAFGISAKMLQDKFIMNEYLVRSPVFGYGAEDSKTAYTGDIGVIWNPLPRFYIGASANDISEPDMGYLAQEKIPSTVRISAGMRKKDSRYACDASYKSRVKELEIAAGFEKYLGLFALRGGLVYGRAGNYDSWRASAGFGFEVSDAVSLDYALVYPLTILKGTYGSHWLSLVFRFGKIPSDEIEPGSLERAYIELSEEKFRLEDRLSRAEREKRKLEEVLIEEATARIREKIKQAQQPAARAADAKTALRPADEISKITSGSRTHMVKKGDTLQSLAEKYYKDSKLWIEIYNANREDIGRGGTLKINQVLIIPPLASQPDVTRSAQSSPPPPHPSATKTEDITITPLPLAATAAFSPPPPVAPQPAELRELKIVPIDISTAPASGEPSVAPPAPPSRAVSPPRDRPAAAKAKTHTVKPGENLRSIAEKYYNNPEKWREILDANKDKIIRGQVRPGTELTIP